MTPFQKVLKSHVWGYKALERHWFPKGEAPKLLRIPSTGDQVTLKRAVYAAFRGDVPEDVDLRSSCGATGCIAPDHQEFAPSRAGARALHVPDLDGIGVDARPNRLPRGLSISLVARVKELGRLGNSLDSICAVTMLDRSTVMKVRGGVYDRAVATLKKSLAARKLRREEAEARAGVGQPESRIREESDYPEVDEAEVAAWLRSIQ